MSMLAGPTLDHATARLLASRAFACQATRHRLGLELEWHVYDRADLERRPSPGEVQAAATHGGPLAPGVTISVEPGSQIELDTPPLPLTAALDRAQRAASELRSRLRRVGLEPVAVGADPHREPENLLDVPRYRAMADTFAARGRHGVQMMANTAAFQINVDLDPRGDRWRLVHQLGPVLVAAFANSPVGPGGDTDWQSGRLATWWAIDSSRTRPVDHRSGDPAQAWLRYALDANVLLIRRDGEATALSEPLSFERWMREGHPLGPPTVDDFDYHLTTLFPPVRPRGSLEFRFLDALEHPHWLVATALVAGVLDERCLPVASQVTEPATDRWLPAARQGLADEGLAAIAEEVVDLALEGLARQEAATSLVRAVRRWRDTELAERRSPAAAVWDRWERSGTVVAPLEEERV